MSHLTKPRTSHTHARTHMHKHTHTVHTSHQAISQIHTTQRQTHIPQIAASQKHTPYQRHTHHTDVHIPCKHTACAPCHRYIYHTYYTHHTHTRTPHIHMHTIYQTCDASHTNTHARHTRPVQGLEKQGPPGRQSLGRQIPAPTPTSSLQGPAWQAATQAPQRRHVSQGTTKFLVSCLPPAPARCTLTNPLLAAPGLVGGGP